MALDIVTSYQGTNHITADQMADFQRGLLGDACILPVGNKMKVNIQTANQITVSDGVVVYDGREFHIPYGTSENVAITSGTQGMMRNDIVCIQYSRNESTGIESAKFVTIAGTPKASSPQDPSYSNLDIRTGVFMSQKPFCRVRLNGTAIEKIDMLVGAYENGIYQLNNDLNDSGWIYPTIGGNFEQYSEDWKPRYRKIGKWVQVCGAVKPKASMTLGQEQIVIFTLPEGFRPAVNIPALNQGSIRTIWYFEASANGSVCVSRSRNSFSTYDQVSAGNWFPFNATFIAEH